ncbi:transposable element Tcb1 transposase [Trichonephila clavipes]|nr:transposable element Tcb1 transposase [Trichonephila clavipes]
MLGRRIAAREPLPTCLPEFQRALLDVWCNIPQDQIDNLILSMSTRCKHSLTYVFGAFIADDISGTRSLEGPTVNSPSLPEPLQMSDEAHFWLNGCVNKQNCRIWSEANPQVYVETPLHPEKLTVWCALWAGGILLQKR